jgi:hypothetical protein
MAGVAHLTLLLTATACSGFSALFEFSVGGLFKDLYLQSTPASILLVYNSLWAVLFPSLYIFVIATTALLAASFLLQLCGLCCAATAPRLHRIVLLCSATCLSVAVATSLTGVLMWAALSILPPGLWGGRWGRGAILFATSLVLSAGLLCLAKRAPHPPLLPLQQQPTAAPPPQQPLPLARVVTGQDKGGLSTLPVYQQQSGLFQQHQRNMGHS